MYEVSSLVKNYYSSLVEFCGLLLERNLRNSTKELLNNEQKL